MKTLKKIFWELFKRKEKTRRWNWILRIGVIIFCLAAALTIFAIVLTVAANVEGLKLLGMELNDASAYSGIAACGLAIISMFFIFCGKVEKVEN